MKIYFVYFTISILAMTLFLQGCRSIGESDYNGDDNDDNDDTDDSGPDSDSDIDSDTDGDTDTFVDTESDMETNIVTAIITVPSEFSATPVALIPAFYDSYPPAGMPIGIGDLFSTPSIGPYAPYTLVTGVWDLLNPEQELAPGNYYLAAVLYVEGGGTYPSPPTPNVDWGGTSPTVITLPSFSVVDVGVIQLAPVPD